MDLLSRFLYLFKASSTFVDNWTFTLHYKVTTVILIALSVVTFIQQYFGDPIDCFGKDDVFDRVLDTYCWIHATYSLPDAFDKKAGDEVPYPGVDKYSPGEKRVHHSYYQFVGFFLFLQAIFFYIPRYFWRLEEGGRVRKLMLGFESSIVSEEADRKNRKLIVNYFSSPLRHNDRYFICFVLAEIMNFVNVVGQIFFMDSFLGGGFSSRGINVLFNIREPHLRFDPLIQFFPRMAKCTLYRYSSSGDVQKSDAMCVLTNNSINEKIFIFLLFWFVILAVISGLALVYRAAIISSKDIRIFSTKSRVSMCDVKSLEIVIKNFSLGDWLLLDLLAENVDFNNFKNIVDDLSQELDGRIYESLNTKATTDL